MRLRWKVDENTPLRFVPAGTVAEVDGALAKELLAARIAEPDAKPAERAVKASGAKAVKK